MSKTIQNKDYKISWSKIATDCKAMVKRLEPLNIDGIIAVARGGMVPASLFGRLLGIHNFEVLVLSSYNDKVRGDISVIRKPKKRKGNWILVDELADSGSTAVRLRELYPDYPIVVLYTKTSGRDKPDFYHEEFSDDTWLVFPWELLKK